MEAGSAVPTRSYTYDGATPQSLAAFLLRECREHFCAYGHCKRALSKGRVKIDGVVAHAGQVVTAGQIVSFEPTHEVRLMQDAAGSTHRRIVYYERVPVVAETDHWAVVLKPPGLVKD